MNLKEFRKLKSLQEKFVDALEWRLDIERGEMLEDRWHHKTHMGYPDGVSSQELDFIVDQVNHFFIGQDSKLRIGWSMGEIYPGEDTQRKLL